MTRRRAPQPPSVLRERIILAVLDVLDDEDSIVGLAIGPTEMHITWKETR